MRSRRGMIERTVSDAKRNYGETPEKVYQEKVFINEEAVAILGVASSSIPRRNLSYVLHVLFMLIRVNLNATRSITSAKETISLSMTVKRNPNCTSRAYTWSAVTLQPSLWSHTHHLCKTESPISEVSLSSSPR